MSFALFLVYVLFTFLRPVELLAPDTELRPMLWLWLIAFVAALARALSKRQFAASGVHMVLLGGFTLAIAMSQITNGWFGGGLDAVSNFSSSALLFVLVCMNVTSIRRLRATCAVMVVALVFGATMSVYSYHTGYRAEELVLQQGGFSGARGDGIVPDSRPVPAHDTSGLYMWRVRWLGFLNDPNDFAQAMVMAMPLLWATYRPGRRWRTLMLLVLPSLALLYAIYLTHSRGAMLGVGAMLAVGLRRRLGPVKSAMMVALLAGAAIVSSMGGEREFSSKEGSAGERIEAWSTGLMMLKSHPLFGVGYGNFTEHHYLTAHNSFVLCFSELGLFGYFTWLGLLVVTYKGMSRVMASRTPDSAEFQMAELLRMAFVGFLVCAWFLSRTYQPTLYFLLGLCVAAWHCAKQGSEAGQLQALRLGPSRWGRGAWGAVFGSLTLVYGFVRLHYA
ncbi:O-antigen ligase family protein [Caldimonas brevitalea]|uniref:Membrane protein n=1 Tax=Caldimonas brevitalea TaxID=413882 RepID=A0A0G3BTP2_9BURK|nr:O-antigen ligase family protein [Caldimonas brevitalea]AKJ29895.1 membrane protein [Caldimonas brevitalea]